MNQDDGLLWVIGAGLVLYMLSKNTPAASSNQPAATMPARASCPNMGGPDFGIANQNAGWCC